MEGNVGFLPPFTKQEQACSVFRSQLWRMQPVGDSEGNSVNIAADAAIGEFLRKFPNCGATRSELFEAWPCPADEIKLLAERWEQHIMAEIGNPAFFTPAS